MACVPDIAASCGFLKRAAAALCCLLQAQPSALCAGDLDKCPDVKFYTRASLRHNLGLGAESMLTQSNTEVKGLFRVKVGQPPAISPCGCVRPDGGVWLPQWPPHSHRPHRRYWCLPVAGARHS
jgi:hypothetical protein